MLAAPRTSAVTPAAVTSEAPMFHQLGDLGGGPRLIERGRVQKGEQVRLIGARRFDHTTCSTRFTSGT
jgi:hypothetical protein